MNHPVSLNIVVVMKKANPPPWFQELLVNPIPVGFDKIFSSLLEVVTLTRPKTVLLGLLEVQPLRLRKSLEGPQQSYCQQEDMMAGHKVMEVMNGWTLMERGKLTWFWTSVMAAMLLVKAL